MRVLGIDPGLTRCGFGVVDGGPARSVRLEAVGVITSARDAGVDARLLEIYQGLVHVIEQYAPDIVAVERVFSQNNVSTVMGTAQVSGLAIVLAAERGIPVAMHTPSEVKRAITGNGRADKAQVQTMVQKILHLDRDHAAVARLRPGQVRVRRSPANKRPSSVGRGRAKGSTRPGEVDLPPVVVRVF